MEYNRAALKQEVKYDLQNTSPRAVIVSLVYLLVTFALSLIVEVGQMPLTNMLDGVMADIRWLSEELTSGVFNERALFQALDEMDLGDALKEVVVFSGIFSLISSVINWTLTYGYEGYCLGMVRRKNPGYTRLLCAFPKWGWVILAGFLVGLFTALWAILIVILALLATVAVIFLVEGSWGVTLTIVIWLAAMAWFVSITLRYAMTNYILLDEKVDALEAISRSKAMMRGRKWHLFVLELSFMGWILLAGLIGGVVGGIASLAVGDPHPLYSASDPIIVTVVTELAVLPLMMWLQPYMVGSTAKFYNWMKHTDIAHGVWEGRYPKRRQPIQTQPEPQQEEQSTQALPEIPHIPAYEEPAAQPEQPREPEQPVESARSAAPTDDVPDRPNYE